jgi:assimilatory nitrate reductase catalytic subunit
VASGEPSAPPALLRRGLRRHPDARRARRFRGHRGRPGSSGQSRPPLFQGLGARRDGRSTAGCCIPSVDGVRTAGTRRSIWWRNRFRAPSPSTGRIPSPLRLGPVADRGLLRRQQADEGLHRQRNIDTNSRLCMASSVAGHKPRLRRRHVPGTYEDLEQADLIVLVGSNLAWCHPVLWQRIEASGAAADPVVVIDPRRTVTAEQADLHLAIAPDGDVALFNGLLAIWPPGRLDRCLCRRHVDGFGEPPSPRPGDRPRLPAQAGFRRRRLRVLSTLRCRAPSAVVTVFQPGRQPVGVRAPTRSTRSSTATLPPAASAAPAWARSRSPASPTPWAGAKSAGWPTCSPATWASNPMPRAHRRRAFWGSARHGAPPRPQGRRHVPRRGHEGRIKAVWIMATNPAVRCPRPTACARRWPAATFVVVSGHDRRHRHRAAGACPAAGARPGARKTAPSPIPNADQPPARGCSRRPGEARADWRIISDVAARMGWAQAFRYRPAVGDVPRICGS